MMINIIENGRDLLLTHPTTRQSIYLHNPTWRNLLETLRDFADVAKTGNTNVTGVKVGMYSYNTMINEHVLTFFHIEGRTNGWIADHIGTSCAYPVEVLEASSGTIFMIRNDLEQWTSTHQPQPGMFFKELQTLSNFETPKVAWSSTYPVGNVVAVVESYSIILYPDSWGESMWVFVAGSQLW